MLTYDAGAVSILVDGKPLVPLGSPASADERARFERMATAEFRVTVNDEATPALSRILRAWRMVHPWRHEWVPTRRKPSPEQKRKAKRKAQRQARRRQR